tara:strand:- start:151 stop:966 length:816 start_codon:yes stop_codon:yes gene_type:complete
MISKKKTLLITLGCSWTYGEGAGCEPGMSHKEYEKIRYSSDYAWKFGWRRHVVEHFDIDHVNLGEPGSSNQKQFHYAKNYFLSSKFAKEYKSHQNVIVLWGLTTLRRNFMYFKESEKYENMFLEQKNFFQTTWNTPKDKMTRAVILYCHDDKVSLRELQSDIQHWNQHFKLYPKIKNYWYDIFGSKNYTTSIRNFIDGDKEKRDLLYRICKNHASEENIDPQFLDKYSTCFGYAEDHGLVNPHSLHPYKTGYKFIGDYFIKFLTPHIEDGL